VAPCGAKTVSGDLTSACLNTETLTTLAGYETFEREIKKRRLYRIVQPSSGKMRWNNMQKRGVVAPGMVGVTYSCTPGTWRRGSETQKDKIALGVLH